MSPCSLHRENLALRAGGDLPSGSEASALELHLQACEPCQGLQAALEGDRVLVARAARQPDPFADATSLVTPVLARAAAEALAEGSHRSPAAAPARDFGLAAFGRMAAAVAIVAAAALLGYGLLSHEAAQVPASVAARSPALDMAPPSDLRNPAAAPLEPLEIAAVPVAEIASADLPAGPGPASPQFRPVRVHRAGGPAVELEWDGDGRETAPGGVATPYKVLASASPRDFSGARPVLVAGRKLVTNSDLPSLRTADRSVTFFRVE